jgi:hypothetical protein
MSSYIFLSPGGRGKSEGEHLLSTPTLVPLCLIHDPVGLARFVIPGLTRNPVSFSIPAFAGMTHVILIHEAVRA